MRIGSRERFATAVLLTVIALITLSVWQTFRTVESASGARRLAAEIASTLVNLRLVTFEHSLHTEERSRVQWVSISQRLDGLIERVRPGDAEEHRIVDDMREKRAQAKRLFAEVALAPGAQDGGARQQALEWRFRSQIFTRLFIVHQDNVTAAFRLMEIAADRSEAAQRRLLAAILFGLSIIAIAKIGVSWLIHRSVLAPVAELQHAAQRVAAGHWNVEFARRGNDEIGQLSRDLGKMTQTLRGSLGQVERSNRKLAALNKELEAFSYSVSHDLRSPLRSMDGFSLALLQDYGERLDEDGKDYLNRIRAACQRMGRLIDDLLGLSRVTRTELRVVEVNLSALAHEVAGALKGQDETRSTRWRVDENLTVRADRDLMRIALQNLLENAWKFTGRTPMATIHFGAREEGGQQVFFVADNGAGFDMAYAAKLFGAFQRLHHVDEFPGTGIGLAIVQRIVQRHGGRVWAQAQPGAGATFSFTLEVSGNDDRGQDDPAG
jgi:signal transduction histidine kinase